MNYLDDSTTADLIKVQHRLATYFAATKPDQINTEMIVVYNETLNELWAREPKLMKCFYMDGEYDSLFDYILADTVIVDC